MMGHVFGSKTTVWFRLKIWLQDLADLFLALPSYISPKPLKSAPLTEEEIKEIEILSRAEIEDLLEPQKSESPNDIH